MTTALYRKNGGEVIKISVLDQPFSEVNSTYWGVLTDPTTPDGIEVKDAEGNLRVLGFAKFADVGGNSVRNATQPEIDAFAPAQTQDENLQDKDAGESLFDMHPRFRKVFRAMLREFADEFDRSRVNPKGQLSIINNNTSELMVSATWQDIAIFATQGESTVSHDSITADHLNNRIQLDKRGRHLCFYHMSIEGDDNTEFLFDVSRNGSRTDRLRSRIKLQADGTRPMNFSAMGILHFPDPAPNYITLSCRNMMGTDRNLIVRECQFVLVRNENRAKRPHTELITEILNRFDEND